MMDKTKSTKKTSTSNRKNTERADAKKTRTPTNRLRYRRLKSPVSKRQNYGRGVSHNVLEMTQNFDLNKMSIEREQPPTYRDGLEHKIKDKPYSSAR